MTIYIKPNLWVDLIAFVVQIESKISEIIGKSFKSFVDFEIF